MANKEHLEILNRGIDGWNQWRKEHPEIMPELANANLHNTDLTEVNLSGAELSSANLNLATLDNANLSYANLIGAQLVAANMRNVNISHSILDHGMLLNVNLSRAILVHSTLDQAILANADLSNANLKDAHLRYASLQNVNLSGANLSGADLSGIDLSDANVSEANLSGANLQRARLIKTNFKNSILLGCTVFGISVWEIETNGADQSDLIITTDDEPTIMVDNLEVAQFIYLLLNRKKLRAIIDTITSKAVLILGRFTPERKIILDTLANELRKYSLLPIIFDFDRATNKDFTETIKTLAGMSLFVIADITNPKSAPLELQATVPDYKIPFVPIIQEGETPFSMFNDLTHYPWMIDLLFYPSLDILKKVLKRAIIDPAFERHKELQMLKAERMKTRKAEDYLFTSEHDA